MAFREANELWRALLRGGDVSLARQVLSLLREKRN